MFLAQQMGVYGALGVAQVILLGFCSSGFSLTHLLSGVRHVHDGLKLHSDQLLQREEFTSRMLNYELFSCFS